MNARLVEVRKDQVSGVWRVRCAVCGPLGEFWKYWTASRAAGEHEEMHSEDVSARGA